MPHQGIPAGAKVDDEPRKIEPLVRVPGIHAPPAQMGPNAAHQLRRAERLGDVIVDAHLEPYDDACLALVCREHDDRYAARPPDLLADGDTVDARQHYVQYDEVEGS